LEGSVEAIKLEKKSQEPPQEDDLSSVEIKKEDVESAAPSSSQVYYIRKYLYNSQLQFICE